MNKELLRMEHITSYFSGRKTLDHARLNLFAGEIIGLVGVNNAGKTELAGAITGASPFVSGRMYLEERAVHLTSIVDARKSGIYYFSNSSSLISEFSIWENFLLGPKGKKIFVDSPSSEVQCEGMLELLGIHIGIHTPVSTLSLKEKLLVEIARAVYYEAKILILDDVLNKMSATALEEFSDIFRMLCSLRMGIILIDSGIRCLKRYCHRLFVMREGKTVAVLDAEDAEDNFIISLLLGKSASNISSSPLAPPLIHKNILLEMQHIGFQNILSDISFKIFEGEIAGILNINKHSGRAIKQLLHGNEMPDSGKILFHHSEISLSSPENALRLGISTMAEQDAIFPYLTIEENLAFPALQKDSRFIGIVNESELKYIAHELMTEYIIPYKSLLINNLDIERSRILRRKISFCRMLSTHPKLAILINPTQSIDVTSKDILYQDIRSLKKHKTTGLVISSDVKELLAVCDRVIVVNRGKAEFIIPNNEDGREKLFYIYRQYLKNL